MSNTSLATAAPSSVASMTTAGINAMVTSTPPEGRAALGRVLAAARDHVKTMRKSYGKAFALGRAVVVNAWFLGEVLGELDLRPGQPKKNGSPGDHSFTLADLGVNKTQPQRCQKLRDRFATVEDLDEYIEAVRDEEKYTLPSLRPLSDHNIALLHGGRNMHWYTPVKYVEKVRAVMGSIDLDPASCAKAQETIRATMYYTQEDDGLQHAWQGSVYCNPPYCQPEISDFVAKLCDEFEAGNVKQAILLTNNATDTTWWRRAIEAGPCVCFTTGRIKFYNDAGEGAAPTNGQCFIYFGDRVAEFQRHFADVGMCLVRPPREDRR